MASLIGFFIGAAVITFLLVFGLNWVVKKFIRNPLFSFGISAVVTAALATYVYGFNTHSYILSAYVYGIASALWFAIGVARATKKRRETESDPPSPSGDLSTD